MQVNRPIAMIKDVIQTRNRKMTSKNNKQEQIKNDAQALTIVQPPQFQQSSLPYLAQQHIIPQYPAAQGFPPTNF